MSKQYTYIYSLLLRHALSRKHKQRTLYYLPILLFKCGVVLPSSSSTSTSKENGKFFVEPTKPVAMDEIETNKPRHACETTRYQLTRAGRWLVGRMHNVALHFTINELRLKYFNPSDYIFTRSFVLA